MSRYSVAALSWYNNTGTGMARFPGVTSGGAGNLALGTSIDAGRSYAGNSTQEVTFGANPGNWVINATNYFGFRFSPGACPT